MGDAGTASAIVKSLHWRVWVVGYLLWLIAFTVVEGTGRQVCRMPMQKWINAAASQRDRDAREWFRDRANECLHLTRWYSYSTAGLFALGLIAPLGGISIITRQRMRDDIGRERDADLSRTIPWTGTVAFAYSAVLVLSLAVTLGTLVAVRWAYDHLG